MNCLIASRDAPYLLNIRSPIFENRGDLLKVRRCFGGRTPSTAAEGGWIYRIETASMGPTAMCGVIWLPTRRENRSKPGKRRSSAAADFGELSRAVTVLQTRRPVRRRSSVPSHAVGPNALNPKHPPAAVRRVIVSKLSKQSPRSSRSESPAGRHDPDNKPTEPGLRCRFHAPRVLRFRIEFACPLLRVSPQAVGPSTDSAGSIRLSSSKSGQADIHYWRAVFASIFQCGDEEYAFVAFGAELPLDL
jgi:hypothetical protein